mmetsp:Transcript_31712/g.93029  ORF Transcript_31712/g.93029 Transcript_31712/m.93029 type:complete len:238 (+) Transcript_31712:295-1008(+)
MPPPRPAPRPRSPPRSRPWTESLPTKRPTTPSVLPVLPSARTRRAASPALPSPIWRLAPPSRAPSRPSSPTVPSSTSEPRPMPSSTFRVSRTTSFLTLRTSSRPVTRSPCASSASMPTRDRLPSQPAVRRPRRPPPIARPVAAGAVATAPSAPAVTARRRRRPSLASPTPDTTVTSSWRDPSPRSLTLVPLFGSIPPSLPRVLRVSSMVWSTFPPFRLAVPMPSLTSSRSVTLSRSV